MGCAMWFPLALLLPAAAADCHTPGVAYGDAATAAVPSAGFTADAAGCAMTCGGDAFCKAYTWKENTVPKGGCWHFPAADPPETMDVGAVSGPKECEDTVAAGATAAATSLGAELGDIGDAVTAGVNDAVESMNGEAAAAASALPTVPPLPEAPAPAAVPSPKAAAAVVTDAVTATEAPVDLEQIAKAEKDKKFGLGFGSCLLLVVVAAFSLRICAHYSFNDHNNAKREEKNKRAKSDAAEKQAKRDDEEAASAPASPLVQPGAAVLSQGAVLSGYGAPPLVMPAYQAASPSGYAPVVSVGTQQYVRPA